VAIEKSYFSQYGWEVPSAYYKVQSWLPIKHMGERWYEFKVEVFKDEQSRTDGMPPIGTNRMKIDVEDSVDVTDENEMKTICYNELKVLTKSFRNDGVDV